MHSGVHRSFPSSRSVSSRVSSPSAALAVAVAAGLLAACSRPNGDELYRPFGAPSQLEDGLPDAGEVLAGGETLGDAGLAAPAPQGDAGQDLVPDAGGDAPSIPDAASNADAGHDAGPLPSGDAGSSYPFGYWGFDDASELASFQFTDSGLVSAREWHAADQHTATGHLVLTVPLTAAGESVEVSMTPPAPTDLAGHVLKIRIQRLSGSRSGGVEAFVDSGSGSTRVSGSQHTFASLDVLTDISLDFASATAPDQIVRYGIYVHSGNGPAATQVLMIDSLWIE